VTFPLHRVSRLPQQVRYAVVVRSQRRPAPPLAARREQQFTESLEQGQMVSYCKGCIRSIAADKDEQSALVRAAITAHRNRRREHLAASRKAQESV